MDAAWFFVLAFVTASLICLASLAPVYCASALVITCVVVYLGWDQSAKLVGAEVIGLWLLCWVAALIKRQIRSARKRQENDRDLSPAELEATESSEQAQRSTPYNPSHVLGCMCPPCNTKVKAERVGSPSQTTTLPKPRRSAADELAVEFETFLNTDVPKALEMMRGRQFDAECNNPAAELLGVDVEYLMAAIARVSGPVTPSHGELLSAIGKRIWPEVFSNADKSQCAAALTKMIAASERVNGVPRVPDTLTALRRYDVIHNTQVARSAAALFISLVHATAHCGNNSVAVNGIVGKYQALLGPYLTETDGGSISATTGDCRGRHEESCDQAKPVDGEESYAVLGVKPSCSLEELTEAWHIKVKQWHPDRLDGMAPELKEHANRELARINAAYEQLQERVAQLAPWDNALTALGKIPPEDQRKFAKLQVWLEQDRRSYAERREFMDNLKAHLREKPTKRALEHSRELLSSSQSHYAEFSALIQEEEFKAALECIPPVEEQSLTDSLLAIGGKQDEINAATASVIAQFELALQN